MISTERRTGRRQAESERTDPRVVSVLRGKLVRRIRAYHYDRKPGQTRMPYIWETVYRFRGETTAEDIRAIVSHRVDASEMG